MDSSIESCEALGNANPACTIFISTDFAISFSPYFLINPFWKSSIDFIRSRLKMGLLYDIAVVALKYWHYALFIAVIARLIRNKYKPGLHNIPGPFLASISDIWLLQHCMRGKSQTDYLLHRKYNTTLLRLAPNVVSVSDSDAVRIIYGWKPVFKKVCGLFRGMVDHDFADGFDRVDFTFLNT